TPRAETSRSWTDTLSFGQRQPLIGLDVCPVLLEAVRPADVHAVGLCRRAKAHVDREVVLGQVAASALDLAKLCDVAGDDPQAGADRAAVRRRADETQLQPMVIGRRRRQK